MTGITANAIDVVVETGDAGPMTPIGINLPNDERIRERHGSKSVSLANVMEAYDRSLPAAYWAEFSWTREEAERAAAWSGAAAELTTSMHEVIGHGSGQADPALGTSAQAALREHYSTIEETRADLVALYFVPHPKLAELGIVQAEHQAEIACAEYEAFARNALVQLRRVREGTHLEEDHMRNRQLIVRWLMAHTHAVQERWRDGKTFYVVTDVHGVPRRRRPAAGRGPADQEPGRLRGGPRAGRDLRRALRPGAARRDRRARAARQPAVVHGVRDADARARARTRRRRSPTCGCPIPSISRARCWSTLARPHDDDRALPDPRALPRPVAALLLLVFLAVLVRTAWISDDALISLRTVLNVTHGYGLTFNIGERVQTFTHPLWLAC